MVPPKPLSKQVAPPGKAADPPSSKAFPASALKTSPSLTGPPTGPEGALSSTPIPTRKSSRNIRTTPKVAPFNELETDNATKAGESPKKIGKKLPAEVKDTSPVPTKKIIIRVVDHQKLATVGKMETSDQSSSNGSVSSGSTERIPEKAPEKRPISTSSDSFTGTEKSRKKPKAPVSSGPTKRASKKGSKKRPISISSDSSTGAEKSPQKPKASSLAPWKEPELAYDHLCVLPDQTIYHAKGNYMPSRGGDDDVGQSFEGPRNALRKKLAAPRSPPRHFYGNSETPSPPAVVLTIAEIKDRTELTTYYFAYGKEVPESYMKKRFPGCKLEELGICYTPDYTYTLNADAFVKAVRTQPAPDKISGGLWGYMWRVPNFVRRGLEAKAVKHGLKFVEVAGLQLHERHEDYEVSDWYAPLVTKGEPMSAWMGVGELIGNEAEAIELVKNNRLKFEDLHVPILFLCSEAVPSPWIDKNIYDAWIGRPKNPFESGYWGLKKPKKTKEAKQVASKVGSSSQSGASKTAVPKSAPKPAVRKSIFPAKK